MFSSIDHTEFCMLHVTVFSCLTNRLIVFVDVVHRLDTSHFDQILSILTKLCGVYHFVLIVVKGVCMMINVV